MSTGRAVHSLIVLCPLTAHLLIASCFSVHLAATPHCFSHHFWLIGPYLYADKLPMPLLATYVRKRSLALVKRSCVGYYIRTCCRRWTNDADVLCTPRIKYLIHIVLHAVSTFLFLFSVIIFVVPWHSLRNYLLIAHELGMANGDFAFLCVHGDVSITHQH